MSYGGGSLSQTMNANKMSQATRDALDAIHVKHVSQAKEYESVCEFYCDQGYTLTKEGTDQNVEIYEQVRQTSNFTNFCFYRSSAR